jgi:hypothetical protein
VISTSAEHILDDVAGIADLLLDTFLVVWQVLHAYCQHVQGSAAGIACLLPAHLIVWQVLHACCLHLDASAGYVL